MSLVLLASLWFSSTGDANCNVCHTTENWSQVSYDHSQTRLPLLGRHAEVPCRACHENLKQLRLDPRCGACHIDPHAGRLGTQCERCHESTNFRQGAGVEAHSQTRFPLYGRHAAIPCEQCHQARSDWSFGSVPATCSSCHRADFQRTATAGLNHVTANLSTDCQNCHTTTAWQRGVFAEHEHCFPIQSGRHAGISCFNCHTSLGTFAQGACNTFTAACTRCHPCARVDPGHSQVAGFQCANRKCYECHPSGTTGR